MAYYYKYQFISPEMVFATVKEELKSYFDTGAVDDLMFPTYLDKCLRKLGRSSYVISEGALFIEDYMARLPDNFYAVREAWRCIEEAGGTYQTANSFYSQTFSETIQVAPITVNGTPCNNPQCVDPNCTGGCLPNLLQAVYKTNQKIPIAYRREYLLKPGNISAHRNCSVEYSDAWSFFKTAPSTNGFTPGSASYDSFDIRDNKFVTNFSDGIVHLVFYATEYDKVGNQLIPDNYRIREYIEAFIKYKVFETLTNQTNDETFQQLQQKMVYYKQLADEAFILANVEIMKQDMYTKQNRLKRDLNRFRMYELPNRTYRNWRRN